MTDDQIKYLANRFLAWRLPDNFNPDGGVSFKPIRNEKSPWPAKNEPVGTNLLDYTQAEQMIRYLVDGMPCGSPVETRLTAEQFATEQCGWIVHDRKHQTATLEEVFELAEAFRDKSEAGLREETVLLEALANKRGLKIEGLQEEIERLKATNRELNRRCQALTHTINTNSDRKTWYGYYQAALSIAGWEEEKRKAAEAEAAALRERCETFVEHTCTGSALCKECRKALSAAPERP